jgi:hypothetical protein
LTNGFDIVVVPDFAADAGSGGRHESTFEARTLLFLAAWTEHGGAARDFPLHLACIGRPPPSVRRLAERCGADISVHQPLVAGVVGYANKLRGLEIEGRTQRLLLLDADTLVLGDLGPLAELVEFDSISVPPAGLPRVPERHWQPIYAAVGQVPPPGRMASQEAELGLMRFAGKGLHAMAHMYPQYDSGILLIPWSWAPELRVTWERHMAAIAQVYAQSRDAEWASLRLTDTAGLATAIEHLKSHGLSYAKMPDAYRAGWRHIYTRALPLRRIKILHATGLFLDLPSGGGAHLAGIAAYQRRLLSRFCAVWWRSPGGVRKVKEVWGRWLPAVLDALRLGRKLRALESRYVRPVLRDSNLRVADGELGP